MMAEGQSTAERLLEAERLRQEQEKKDKEEFEELKVCANRLFSSPDGQRWAKKAFGGLAVNRRDNTIFNQPLLLAADKALYYFYLKYFKELLKPEVLSNIERGE